MVIDSNHNSKGRDYRREVLEEVEAMMCCGRESDLFCIISLIYHYQSKVVSRRCPGVCHSQEYRVQSQDPA